MARVILKAGHVRPVWSGHPWVFAQAVDRLEGSPAPGDVVSVLDPRGRLLGKGFWSPRSAIPVRILTREPEDALDAASLERRLRAASTWRHEVLGLPSEATTGFRMVNSEGDHLGGLIVDWYDGVAVVQLSTLGMKRREEQLYDIVHRTGGAAVVVEMASRSVQRLEGFQTETRVVRGEAPSALAFRERGLRFRIPLAVAQKTGFYFDQRPARARVEELAANRRVLDAYCYCGAFALAAARGGATEVWAVDRSSAILEVAAQAAEANDVADRIRFLQGDVRRVLRDFAAAGERFDLVVVDPPNLAPTARHLEAGRRAYLGLNASAIRLLQPGGLLLTCSCSGAVDDEELLRLVGRAAARCGRSAHLLSLARQGPDHPTPAAFSEGRYLTCALLRIE